MRISKIVAVIIISMTSVIVYGAEKPSLIDEYRSFKTHFTPKKLNGLRVSTEDPKGEKLGKQALDFLADGISNLSPEWKRWVSEQWKLASSLYYGLYKIDFDSTLDSFLVRGPGKYVDPSAIYLILVDKETHRLISYKEVAENWGDEGVTNDWRSWFIDVNDDGRFEIVTRYRQIDLDNNKDTFVEVFKWSGNDWLKIKTPETIENEYQNKD